MCPSKVAYGQDIADQGAVSRTQQAVTNSLKYKTLEDQARFSHEAAINATLAWDARDNAGTEPYQTDGYESSSTTSYDSLNQIWYTAKAKNEEDSESRTMKTLPQTHQTSLIGWLPSKDVLHVTAGCNGKAGMAH